MSSSVYYKFKFQKEETRVTFDGTGISVFDLKKEILVATKLENTARDIDLLLFDTAGQEYKNDSQIIPRSTSVIVKRMPASKPGKGKAAIYLSGGSAKATTSSDSATPKTGSSGNTWARPGHLAMSRRFDGREEKPKHSPTPTPEVSQSSSTTDDEGARIRAMFQASTEQWNETQEKMAQATPIYKEPRGGPRKTFQPREAHYEPKPLPPGYICHRCSKKGHWIQDCPTNDDREFDNRPRIKRTTGIPKSFLKAVDMPGDGALPTSGVMVTPDGGFVVAQPDSAAWQKQRMRPKGLTTAEVREKPPTDSTLTCPICSKLFRDAVRTPCCSRTYCEECIQTHLLERDFVCLGCDAKIPSLDKLVANQEMRGRVSEYIQKAIVESRDEEEPGAEPASAETKAVDKATGSTTQTTPHDPEVSFDKQPGHHEDPTQSFEQTIAQLDAQRNHLLLMLQNPALPPAMQMQVQIQAEQLGMQIQMNQQATIMAHMTNSGMFNMNPHQQQRQQQGMNMNMGNMGMNNMGMNMGMNQFQQQQQQQQQQNGYNDRGYKKGEYLPGWTNPFPNQQPAGEESAYQRLPVNNRRRGPKRERPSDFLEVGGEGQQKVARYWE